MSIPGLIIAAFLVYKILQESRRLEKAKRRLKRPIYESDTYTEEYPREEDRVWWIFWGRRR